MKRWFFGAIAGVLIGVAAFLTAATATVPGAGLVVRHGDGRIVIRYVQFQEASISGLDLLKRSGLSVVTAPYPGLGEAVCAIDGEGCPAEDCFCKSYGSPSVYWNYYYIGPSGQWVRSPLGAANRTVKDGDVDGWSWTSGVAGLPPVSVDQIAAMFGVLRGPTPSPTLVPVSPTRAPEPTAVPGTPRPTVTSVPSMVSTTPTSGNTPGTTAVPTATVSPTFTASPAVSTPEAVATPVATPQLTLAPSAAATIGATPAQVGSTDGTGYIIFGVMVGLMAGLIGVLWWRRSANG